MLSAGRSGEVGLVLSSTGTAAEATESANNVDVYSEPGGRARFEFMDPSCATQPALVQGWRAGTILNFLSNDVTDSKLD